MMTLDKFEEASEKVKEVVLPTNLIYSEYFSELTGNKVYLKPENMQYTGAYKVRGAYYKISTMSSDEREKGLITASAGNHALGVAYAAKLYGVPATIVMPTTTPLIKGIERKVMALTWYCMDQYTMKPARKRWNWQRRAVLLLYIRLMMKPLQPVRERLQWKSLRNCRQ